MILLTDKIDKENKALKSITKYIMEKYNAEIDLVSLNKDTFVYIRNKKFDLLLTVCKTNKNKCVKIEEIRVTEKYIGKGIGSNILNDIMRISKEHDCILGLWCEINNLKGYKYYTDLGFKHIETLRDHWFEYI